MRSASKTSRHAPVFEIHRADPCESLRLVAFLPTCPLRDFALSGVARATASRRFGTLGLQWILDLALKRLTPDQP